MPNVPDQDQFQFHPECEIVKLNELKSAAKLYLHFSEIYLEMLRSMSQRCASDKNPHPWKTLKEGSYYLDKAYYLVQIYKEYLSDSTDDENIQKIDNVLVTLEFNPEHVTSGYTEAYDGKALCFVSKGQGTKYYEMLHSDLKKDIRLFIDMVKLNIDIPVKKFLKSIKRRCVSIVSE